MIYPNSVRHISGYKLEVGFSDGLTAVIDLEDELWGPMFIPLKDVEFFRQVRADAEVHTLVWPNGADLAPEFLYDLAQKAQAEAQN